MAVDHRNPWQVEHIEPVVVDRLAATHVPNPDAVAAGVDLVGDPHRESDEGFNWTLLSSSRRVADVVPGSAVVLGSPVGRYLAKVIAWDFEVDQNDPIVVLDLIPLTPEAVERALERSRTSAA